jgi:DNA-binding NarL/FixJ family response regulator
MTTFLIVDDHLPFRQQARALLEGEGLAVVGEAGDGAAAIETVRRIRPDVVVVDISLPDMDGFELAERLALETPRPRIVLTSSRERATYGSRVAASPALGFVQKDDLSASSLLALVVEPPEWGSP